MRNNLENIELIEKYLNGESTSEEKLEVEERLQSNAEFKNQLNVQRNLRLAIQRVALKREISNVVKSPGGNSGFGKWMIGGVIILALGMSVFYFSQSGKREASLPQAPIVSAIPITEIKKVGQEESKVAEKKSVVPSATKNMSISTFNATQQSRIPKPDSNSTKRFDFNGLHTWVKPTVQTYDVKAGESTVIETESGALITVPSDAFMDRDGKLINGSVKLKVVEAINLEDIVLYNLGTTANGEPLQTAGMMHFDYEFKGGKASINPARPMYVQIPTTKVSENMRVFEGEVADGKVNWKNPQPLKKYLINMDLSLLDFLPQGFKDSVETFIPYKSHQALSKKLVDSLYYSLVFRQRNRESASDITAVITGPQDTSKTKGTDNANLNANGNGFSKIIPAKYNKQDQKTPGCGIDPLSIKTIRTPAFQKTFIATKEFEQRVRELHTLENGNQLLKTYVDNLGKDLSFSDSLVALQLKGKDNSTFKKFAAQKLTNIKDADIYQEALSTYFNTKQKEFLTEQQQLETALKTLKKAEMKKLMDEYNGAISKSGTIFSQSFKNSVQQNVFSASASNPSYYSFTWAKSGWVNIDSYLHILAAGSQQVKMNVNGNSGETEVYQYINEVANLTPLNINDNKAIALVPKEDSKYAASMKNTYCMAISKEGDTYKWFDKAYNPYENNEINVNLENASVNSIREKLRAYGVTEDLVVRVDEMKMETERRAKIETEIQKRLEISTTQLEVWRKDEAMIKTLRNVAFKCGVTSSAEFIIVK